MTTDFLQNADVLRIDRIRDLLAGLDALTIENEQPSHRISLYIPTGSSPEDSEKARIHLRNSIADIEKCLSENGDGDADLRPVVRSMEAFSRRETDSGAFWQSQLGGIAIFANRDTVRLLEVAKTFQPASYISTHWHLTPLLELAANADCYWLLSLNQNQVKFYRGSRLGIQEISLPDAPASFTDSETAAARSGEGDDPAAIRDSETEADKENLKRFFAEIDRAVVRAAADSTAPLILAGVDYYLPIYRKINRYGHLSNEILAGNAEHEDANDLHVRASDVLSQEFLQSRKRELLRIKALTWASLVETEIEKILRAAAEGRVAALLAPSDSLCWGRFDSETGKVEKLPESDPGGRDLFQQAAEETLLRDGRLYYLESVKMPKGDAICAELRY